MATRVDVQEEAGRYSCFSVPTMRWQEFSIKTFNTKGGEGTPCRVEDGGKGMAQNLAYGC